MEENEMINDTIEDGIVDEISNELEPILFVLNLNEENRILSACYDNEYIDKSLPRVDHLPEGDLYDWLYVEGEYIYSPIVEGGTE